MLAVGGLLLASMGFACAAKPSGPLISLALADLGYQTLPVRYALAGDTMFTVNFVDEKHLLVTFSTRKLLKRLPDAEPDDQDRSVEAVLLELPTGQVVARTTWRLRDHGQYLFPLGHGLFLLRVRSHLALLNPMAHLPADTTAQALGKPDAFVEEPFVDLHRQFGYLAVSPGGDLLAIETTRERKGAKAAAVSGSPIAQEADEETTDHTPAVQINFFRLLTEAETGAGPGHGIKLVAQSAGVVAARSLVEIPATAEGFLRIVKESTGTWDFDYLTHDGKVKELSPFDTTCMPHPYFVSRSEFVAFGCAGSADKQSMAGFNLRGEETWISQFSNKQLFPYVASAPAAGRFALSRTISSGLYLDMDNLTPEQISGQEVTVFQNFDGRQLLKLQTTPFQRAGQNFDLSADGLAVAVIRNEHVEVYGLPGLTKKDQEAVAAAAKDVPARSEARISLGAVPSSVREGATATRAAAAGKGAAGGEPLGNEAEPAPSAQAMGGASASAAAAEPNTTVNGDETKHRTPPSLYDAEHPKPPQP